MFQARAVRLGGAWSRARQPTWMYSFAWPAPDYGAVHCLDVPFAFDVLDAAGVTDVAGTKAPQSLADDVPPSSGSWARAIRLGALRARPPHDGLGRVLGGRGRPRPGDACDLEPGASFGSPPGPGRALSAAGTARQN